MSAYSIFHLNPSPQVDLESLKEAFLKMSGELHPDKFQTASHQERGEAETRYSQLNTAYQTLKEPKDRLIHLYELEKGEKPPDIQRIPPGTMDLFIEVGQFCQKVDQFMKKHSAASSALEKAGLMGESLALQEEVMTIENKIETLRSQVDQELNQLDAAWRSGEKKLEPLEALYRKYSYISRWKQQLEERKLSLLTA